MEHTVSWTPPDILKEGPRKPNLRCSVSSLTTVQNSFFNYGFYYLIISTNKVYLVYQITSVTGCATNLMSLQTKAHRKKIYQNILALTTWPLLRNSTFIINEEHYTSYASSRISFTRRYDLNVDFVPHRSVFYLIWWKEPRKWQPIAQALEWFGMIPKRSCERASDIRDRDFENMASWLYRSLSQICCVCFA